MLPPLFTTNNYNIFPIQRSQIQLHLHIYLDEFLKNSTPSAMKMLKSRLKVIHIVEPSDMIGRKNKDGMRE